MKLYAIYKNGYIDFDGYGQAMIGKNKREMISTARDWNRTGNTNIYEVYEIEIKHDGKTPTPLYSLLA